MYAQALPQEKGDGTLLCGREEFLALVGIEGALDRYDALRAFRALPADDMEVDLDGLHRPVPSRGILLEGDGRARAQAGQEQIEGFAGGVSQVADQRRADADMDL